VLHEDEPYRVLNVSLAGGLRLIGYTSHLSQDGPRGSGQRLGIYLYWQPTRALTDRFKVFVHAVDDKGRLIGQQDSEPQLWFYPTDEWQVGKVICDFHAVPFSPSLPPGVYSIRVGMYRQDTGQRLAVQDAGSSTVIDDSVFLETMTIK